jgi:pimeloyl-ACP methyl ester carboxylesterase
MGVDWQLFESGNADGNHTVLLLPGGGCSSRSYLELMQEPSLAGLRLVAATMPGLAGTPPPEDFSHASYGRLTAELIKETGADVVVGFSMGANVALEMVEAGLFSGPTVLLGISLSLPDESKLFVNAVRLSKVLGTLPAAVLKTGLGSMAKKIPVSPERQSEFATDFAKNSTRDMRKGLLAYLTWLEDSRDHAALLCETGVATWVVHAEKGDGGLTPDERRKLEACPSVRIVTIPGSVFFLPSEVPDQIANVITEAVTTLGRSNRSKPAS